MSDETAEQKAPVNEPATTEEPQGPKSLEEALKRIADLEEDVQKYRHLARSEEQKKKEHWKRLQELERAQMSETERALAEAEQRGREAAMAEYEAQLRKYKLQTAAAKAGVPEEVLEFIDVNKVFDETGEPNLDLLASFAGGNKKFQKSASDLNIGARSNPNAGQLTRRDLIGKSWREIQELRKAGRLDALMRGELQ